MPEGSGITRKNAGKKIFYQEFCPLKMKKKLSHCQINEI
jgi:hypothetical protein